MVNAGKTIRILAKLYAYTHLYEVPVPLGVLHFDRLTRDTKRHQDDEHDDTKVHHVDDLQREKKIASSVVVMLIWIVVDAQFG